MKAPTFKLKFTAAFVLSTLSHSHASIVRDDVDYQYFRDIAENKGKFTVGASNIEIFDKNGNSVGTMLPNLPMFDFSVISRKNGVATLGADQHVVSVWHNLGYATVGFGGDDVHPDAHHFNYQLTNRYDYDHKGPLAIELTEGMKKANKTEYNKDYHTPRLHKLVTETAPAVMADNNLEDFNQYFDPSKYSSFIRAGSGVQKTRNPTTGAEADKANWAGAYLTGGVPMAIFERVPEAINFGPHFNKYQYGPMITFIQPGDSGSGLFAYNVEKQRWEFIATAVTITSTRNNYMLNRPKYLEKVIANDTLNLNASGEFVWQTSGANSSTISNDATSLTVNLFDPALPNDTNKNKRNQALDHGKTVRINGTGSLTLGESINQGAGALYFNDNFTVNAINDSVTWQGAGVSVADGKNVTWQVKNPENDRLSKIGKGTLTVSGNGTNTGDISVGDGTVVLNQTNGTAFKRVGIVSGRPTVVLGAANQIDPNELYFGFRGGRLDMNGQDIDFNRLQNVDEGAQIVNHNATQSANVTIKNDRLFDPSLLTTGDRVNIGRDLYIWNDGARKQTFYLVPKDPNTSNRHHPPYTSTALWENLGTDINAAKKIVVERKNAAIKHSAFNGVLGETDANRHNGVLNVHYQAPSSENLLMLSGGAKLNGNLTASNGTLLLSGRPTPHAYDFVGKKDVIFEEKYAADWINRTFNASNIIADNNATVHVGRNVSQVNANFTANDSARLSLGVIDGETPICIRSDHTGITQCDTAAMSAAAAAGSPVTAINGNVQLNGASSLNLGKATLTGAVNGSGNVSLKTGSHWVMTDSSQTGDLSLAEGAQITLGGNASTQNTLTIGGNLSGNGKFNLFSDIGAGLTDKIVVNGTASGTHTLNLLHTGSEPRGKNLELMTVKGADQDNQQLEVSLATPFVDLGAFRYGLFKRGNSFWLDLAHRKGTSVSSEIEPEGSVPEPEPETAQPPVQPEPKPEPEIVQPPVQPQPEPEIAQPPVQPLPETETAQPPVQPQPEPETAQPPVQPEPKPEPETAQPPVQPQPETETVQPPVQPQPETETAQPPVQPEPKPEPEIVQPPVQPQPEPETAQPPVQPEPKPEPETVQPAKPITAKGKGSVHLLTEAELKNEPLRIFAMKNLINPEAPEGFPPQKDTLSRYANAAISELSAQGNVLFGIGARLDREIAHVDEQGVRVWAETGKQSGRFSDNLYRPYSQDITLTQIGVENVSGETTLGGVLSRSAADSQFDDAIKGKNTLHQLNLYAKQRFSHGVFAALDAGFGKAESKVGDAAFSRSVVSVGATVGARWQADNGLYLAPSLGARHYRLGGSRYVFDGAVVAIKPLQLTSYQAGVSIGKRFDFGSFSITPEFASYAQAVKSAEKTVSVNGNALSHQFGNRFKHELSVGVQKGGLSVGLSAGVQQGSQSQKQRFGAVKIGYNW